MLYQLTAFWESYCTSQSLEYLSADEMLAGNDLTPEQRKVATLFYQLWESVERIERPEP